MPSFWRNILSPFSALMRLHGAKTENNITSGTDLEEFKECIKKRKY
jgi:hypothetical protein